MNPQRTFVVGDVHGCLRELQALLKKAGVRKGIDRLVFAGDLLDRGPDSVGVVRLAMDYGAEAVMGNHEEKHLRFRREELRRSMLGKPETDLPKMPHPYVHNELTPVEWEWLGRLPLTVWLYENLVVVHGGFAEDSLPRNPHLNSCRIRFADRLTRNSARGSTAVNCPDGAVFWTRMYDGGENGSTSVIYGHQPFGSPNVEVGKDERFWTAGIDTGACYGDTLTGLWVEDGDFVSTRSIRSYYGRDYENVPQRVCPHRVWSNWGARRTSILA